MTPSRPKLRIVEEHEALPAAPKPRPSFLVAPTVAAAVSQVGEQAQSMDASIPLNAAFMVCVGCRVADQALSFYEQAIAHAPFGTFRRDVPPGLKSAQATRAWLGTHLADLKKKSRRADAATAPYERGDELVEATELASAEMVRATEATMVAGLSFDKRAVNVLERAYEALVRAVAYKPKRDLSSSDYFLGTDVLGAS